jgi:[acyl-carrier-protein] S-malonyltransferase
VKHKVVQFPGLGSYAPGVLAGLADEVPEAVEVLVEVDRVAVEYGFGSVSEALLSASGPQIEDLARTPTLLHLAAFAASSALYRGLNGLGGTGDVLLGHSTGEFAALACAGCLSVGDAARVLCEREAALAQCGPAGGLTALRAGERRAGFLCGATGDWGLRPSLFNAPEQTVVSGGQEGLAMLEEVARAAGVQASRLLVVFPHHSTLLAPAAARLAEATSGFAVRDPQRRVFSPLLGGFVEDAADARRIVERHLTDPVRYLEAVRELYAGYGAQVFVEVGARPVLSEFTADCLPASAEVIAPPHRARGVREILLALSGEPLQDRSVAGPSVHLSGTAQAERGPQEPARSGKRTGKGNKGGKAKEPAGPAQDAAVSPPAAAPVSRLPERAQLLSHLREVFALGLGYPQEVLTDDAHLEADLGIASLKKVELLVQVLDEYELPTPPAELRLRDYYTLPKLADLMELLASGAAADAQVGT